MRGTRPQARPAPRGPLVAVHSLVAVRGDSRSAVGAQQACVAVRGLRSALRWGSVCRQPAFVRGHALLQTLQAACCLPLYHWLSHALIVNMILAQIVARPALLREALDKHHH